MQESRTDIESSIVPLLSEPIFQPLRMVEGPEERQKRQRNSQWARLGWYLSIFLFIILPGWYIDHLLSTILTIVFGASFGLFVGYWYMKIAYYLKEKRTGYYTPEDMGMILIPWLFSMMGTWLVPCIYFTYVAMLFYTTNV
jgi:hypothetical protein